MSLPPRFTTSGYISCIKIFGQPILPPLMTEERREEVREDKARALLIEQQVNKKRNSVDSGVMTSSYIDNVKSQNSESINVHGKCDFECHEYKDSPVVNITAIKNLNNNYPHSENGNSEVGENSRPISLDFTNRPNNHIHQLNETDIKLEHGQISDEENMRKDPQTPKNMIRHNSYTLESLSPVLLEHLSLQEKQKTFIISSDTTTVNKTSNNENSNSNKVENLNYNSSPNKQNLCPTFKSPSMRKRSVWNLAEAKAYWTPFKANTQHIRLTKSVTSIPASCSMNPLNVGFHSSLESLKPSLDPQTPKNMIRHNSYTLESPSPVLLEHLSLQEKQKTFIISSDTTTVNKTSNNENSNSNKVENLNYNSSPNKQNLCPTFKSPSMRKRSVWNKAEAKAYWTPFKANTQHMRLTKSVTSIPASCSMNPLNVRFHSSLESLKIKSNISEYLEGCNRRYSNVSCESKPIPASQIRSLSSESFSKINNTDLTVHGNSDLEYDERKLAKKPCQFESTDSKTKSDSVILPQTEESLISNLLILKNNNECNSHLTETAVSAHSSVLSVRGEQYSSSITHEGSSYSHKCNTEYSEDSVSFCSVSSFNHKDNIHKQQEILCSEEQSYLITLKLRHDQQIKELLQRQQEELKQLSVKSNRLCLPLENSDSFADSELESNMTRISSSHSSHICCTELSLDMTGKSERRFCNRELFPRSSGESDKEIRAATIINAYARGFLTRRLLRTERVRQVIETIRESFCALEMRNEQQLELKVLQLHDRLIQQLTNGYHKLHSIFSLSAAERMAIIAADREKEQRKSTYFKSHTVSSATRRTMLRKQNKKLIQTTSCAKSGENNKNIRSRTSRSGTSDSSHRSSRSKICAKSRQSPSPCLSRKPWR